MNLNFFKYFEKKKLKMDGKKKENVLTVDTSKLKSGTCMIEPSGSQLFVVCKENDKIKIFPVDEQSRQKLKKVI